MFTPLASIKDAYECRNDFIEVEQICNCFGQENINAHAIRRAMQRIYMIRVLVLRLYQKLLDTVI